MLAYCLYKNFIKKKMADYPWIKKYPENVDWNTPIEVAPLYRLLDDAAEKYPENTAIDFLGKTYSYQELQNLVDRAAKGLQEMGVKKGTKVGIYLPNCPQFIISYFAILKAGGTAICYSPLYSARELKYQVEDSRTEIMITMNLNILYSKVDVLLQTTPLEKVVIGEMQEVLPFPKNILFPILKFSEIARVPKGRVKVSFGKLLDNDGAYDPVEIDPKEDIAVLQYTGGTTGTPKGAMLTHANLYANTMQSSLWFTDCKPGEEKILAVLPFFHIFAMTVVMNLGIQKGMEIILHPRFELLNVLKDIDAKKPSMMPGVPTMFTAINNCPKLSKYNLSSLQYCLSGGAPLSREIKANFEKLSGCTLVEGYGLTEASPVLCGNPFNGINKTGSVGCPFPGTVIKIMDMEDPKKEVKQGEKGEICASGPQVMKGYLNKPKETKDVFTKKLLRTGDIGYLDEDGYVFILDRQKEMIITGGFNVYPRNVEEVIYENQKVEECAVLGLPDDYLGQKVGAFIKVKNGESLTKKELLTFLKKRLGKHEQPKYVEFRDELPKTMIGKISKKDIVVEKDQ